MLNALVDGIRRSPAKGLHGTCRACGHPVLAKCGPIRIPHWAHKARDACEFSREPETEWHRIWKSHFPSECQECIQLDPLGEKHIADVRFPHGLVIEFQRSPMWGQERASRERFYKNMYWIVDGTRLKRDFSRFAKASESFRSLWQGVYVTRRPEEAFPQTWQSSEVPVFFDFEGATCASPDKMFLTQPLWCLLPKRPAGHAVIFAASKEDFVSMALDQARNSLPQAILSKAAEILDLEHQVQLGRLRAAQMQRRRQPSWRYRRRLRRF